jgi:hypothetical protein
MPLSVIFVVGIFFFKNTDKMAFFAPFKRSQLYFARKRAFSNFNVVHTSAVREGAHKYIDPTTGYDVFTELFHLKRGMCCGKVTGPHFASFPPHNTSLTFTTFTHLPQACRHCPFGHFRANPWERKPINGESGISQRPTWLKIARSRPNKHTLQTDVATDERRANILFWSGSSSSYWALKHMKHNILPEDQSIILLTLFDRDTGRLPFRDVTLHGVMEQALSLHLDLLTVPISMEGILKFENTTNVLFSDKKVIDKLKSSVSIVIEVK